jgi:hypothetical protein
MSGDDPRRWTAARLAQLNRDLAAFDTKARMNSYVHPEHSDRNSFECLMSLCWATDPEVPAWFWPKDMQREFFRPLKRLGLAV